MFMSSLRMSNAQIVATSDALLARLSVLRERRDAQIAFESDLPPRTARIDHDAPERRILARLNAAIDDVRADLCNLHTPMVKSLARRWCGNRRDLVEECTQAGRVGLLEAIDTYDASQGTFSTWAWRLIQRAVALAKHDASDTPLTKRELKIETQIRRTQREYLAANPQADPVGSGVIRACRQAIKEGIAEATVLKILTATRHADLDACAPVGVPCHSEAVIDGELFSTAVAAINLLDEEMHTAVVMRLGLDGTPRATWNEIGDRIGRCSQTAKGRYEEGLDTVRSLMDRTPPSMF